MQSGYRRQKKVNRENPRFLETTTSGQKLLSRTRKNLQRIREVHYGQESFQNDRSLQRGGAHYLDLGELKKKRVEALGKIKTEFAKLRDQSTNFRRNAEASRKEIEDQKAAFVRLEADFKTAQGEKDNVEKKLSAMAQEKKAMTTEIKNLEAKIKKMQQDIEGMQRDLHEKRDGLAEAGANPEEIRALNNTIKGKDKAIQSLRDALKNLDEQKVASEEEYKQAVGILKAEKDELEKSLAGTKAELAKVADIINELTKERDDINDLYKQCTQKLDATEIFSQESMKDLISLADNISAIDENGGLSLVDVSNGSGEV